MSTPTTSRSVRATTHSPSISRSTSQSSRTTVSERAAFSVEPRSDVLRSALAARRARDDPATPSPPEARPIPHRTGTSTTSPAASLASGDPWLDQARSDECISRITPMRRGRRPSEGGLPRFPTQREHQAEEAMKTKMFNMSLQNELLKKQNTELKDQLDEANKRVQDLEPLEDQNFDLREDNNRLTLKMQDMEEKLATLDEQNREILQIQGASVLNMGKQYVALEEAADLLVQSEKEKVALHEEILGLKAQITRIPSSLNSSLNGSDHYHDALDGQAKDKLPSRIHSIDESRPSTSHFDSDYYSQPDSPQVKARLQVKNQTSNEKLSFRERAKHLKEMSLNSQKSMKDLTKRFSDVSMKTLQPRATPEVPKIPEAYDSTIYTAQHAKPVVQTGSWQHRGTPPKTTPSNTTRPPSAMGLPAAPYTPTNPGATEGLRTMFREKRSMERPSHPSSSLRSLARSQSSRSSEATPPLIIPPERASSRFARPSPIDKPRTSSIEVFKTESTPSEYPGSLPTPSVTSEDLSSLPDSERWWEGVRDVRSVATHVIDTRPSRNHWAAGSNRGRAPQGDIPGNFLFNAAEDEEQFIKRAQRLMPEKK